MSCVGIIYPSLICFQVMVSYTNRVGCWAKADRRGATILLQNTDTVEAGPNITFLKY